MSKHATPAPGTTRPITELTDELQERIRTCAYELYEQRGGDHGHDTDDWLQAELELTQQKPWKIAASDHQPHPAHSPLRALGQAEVSRCARLTLLVAGARADASDHGAMPPAPRLSEGASNGPAAKQSKYETGF